MSKQYQNITLDSPGHGVQRLTIDRPKQLNALSQKTIEEFGAAVQAVTADANARVLLITGAGDKAFIAGADISEFEGLTPLAARRLALRGQTHLNALERLEIPVIAVVNGFALGGGCEVALACDWIIAAEDAMFGQPEINLGIMPGFGGSQRLMRLVGKSLAMELCMTGRMIKAKEAQDIGIVNHVFAADTLMNEALQLAEVLASKAPIALKFIKQIMRDGENMTLESACQMEAELFSLCFTTQDQAEGVAAFLGKRKANFKGQ